MKIHKIQHTEKYREYWGSHMGLAADDREQINVDSEDNT